MKSRQQFHSQFCVQFSGMGFCMIMLERINIT